MSKYKFKVNISPSEALDIVKKTHDADLVHEEYSDVGDGKFVGTLIYEKYYFRNSNRAALVVICDNFKGYTEVRSISTGSSQGIFFNIDWGASDEFAHSVKDILEKYIIEETVIILMYEVYDDITKNIRLRGRSVWLLMYVIVMVIISALYTENILSVITFQRKFMLW